MLRDLVFKLITAGRSNYALPVLFPARGEKFQWLYRIGLYPSPMRDVPFVTQLATSLWPSWPHCRHCTCPACLHLAVTWLDSPHFAHCPGVRRSCVDRRRDTTRNPLSSRYVSSRVSSCVTSRSVDRRTRCCLCWCWLLSLTGLGPRLIRVVGLRALSSTRITERRVLSCRCLYWRLTISGRYQGTVSLMWCLLCCILCCVCALYTKLDILAVCKLHMFIIQAQG